MGLFFMVFLNDLYFLLPEFFWVACGVSLLIFGTTLTSKFRVTLITDIGYMFIFYIFCFMLLYFTLPTTEYALLNYQYVSDPFTFMVKLFFLILLILCVSISLDYYFFERIFFVEYYFLINFFCVSSFFLLSSNDLVLFYLSIELQSLILYTLAAIKRYNVFSAESGLKYFVLGAFSSGVLLFSISLFYGFWGLLNFFEIKFLFLGWFGVHTHYAILLAVVFLLSSLLFKLAAAPFHVWTPDVYEGAPSAVVLLFSILPKLVVLVFLSKIFVYFLYEYSFIWYAILFFSGLVSVLVGTFAALNQFNIKRLYAYSGIVNVGYLVTAASYGTLDGFSTLFTYLLVYLVSSFAVFLTLLCYRSVLGLKKIKQLTEYSFFAEYSGVFGVFLGLLFFSLAGIPPLAGFFVKFFIFKAIFSADFMLNPAIFVILITSVISAFYYIRVVRFLFFGVIRSPILFLRLNYFVVFLFVMACFFLCLFFLFQSFFFVSVEYLVAGLYL